MENNVLTFDFLKVNLVITLFIALSRFNYNQRSKLEVSTFTDSGVDTFVIKFVFGLGLSYFLNILNTRLDLYS